MHCSAVQCSALHCITSTVACLPACLQTYLLIVHLPQEVARFKVSEKQDAASLLASASSSPQAVDVLRLVRRKSNLDDDEQQQNNNDNNDDDDDDKDDDRDDQRTPREQVGEPASETTHGSGAKTTEEE